MIFVTVVGLENQKAPSDAHPVLEMGEGDIMSCNAGRSQHAESDEGSTPHPGCRTNLNTGSLTSSVIMQRDKLLLLGTTKFL